MSALVVRGFDFELKDTSELHLGGVILSSQQRGKGEVENYLRYSRSTLIWVKCLASLCELNSGSSHKDFICMMAVFGNLQMLGGQFGLYLRGLALNISTGGAPHLNHFNLTEPWTGPPQDFCLTNCSIGIYNWCIVMSS